MNPPQKKPTDSEERLRQYLSLGNESNTLDYKETFDLSSKKDVVELVKDIGAFLALGGNIVIGAQDDGQPAGDIFSHDLVSKLDPAAFHQKLAKFIETPFEVDLHRHSIDGQNYALITIHPSTSGFCIFKSHGQYTGSNGAQKQVFGPGDVFIRRGTQSTRWNQNELLQSIDRIVERRKESWLQERQADLRSVIEGTQIRAQATNSFKFLSWTMNEDQFETLAIEYCRNSDMIPISLFIEKSHRDAIEQLFSSPVHADSDFDIIIRRVSILIAIGIRLGIESIIVDGVAVLIKIFESLESVAQNGKLVSKRLGIVLEMYGLGALAVRKKHWKALKTIAFQRRSASQLNKRMNWIRFAFREAARHQIIRNSQNGQPLAIDLAIERTKEAAALTADISRLDDELLDSMLQFDLAIGLLVHSSKSAEYHEDDWFPSFAYWSPERVENLIEMLIENHEERRRLVDVGLDGLASIVRSIDGSATQSTRYVCWPGWQSAEINDLLAQY